MTLSEATILIVDDEPVLRMTFAMILRQHGATVHLAAHGSEALQVLAAEDADLMLTDKQMPIMDGITLLRTLYERGSTLPSILFVMDVAPENLADLNRWGVVDTLTKPVHPVRLLQVMRSVLEPLRPRKANTDVIVA